MSSTFSSSSSTNTTPSSFTRSPNNTFLPPLATNPASSNGGPDKGSSLASAALYRPSFSLSILLVYPLITSSVYTFLATLLVLLAISSAIVIRSVFLRRRRRRIIQDAIQKGVWTPGGLAHLARLGVGTEFGVGMGGNAALARTKDIGKKPKMWEVYLHAPEDIPTVSGQGSRAEETKRGKVINSAWKCERGTYWDDILPLHAALVEDDKKDGNSNEGPVQDSPTQEEEEQGLTWWGRTRRQRRRRRTVHAPLSALVWRIAAPHPSMSNPPPSRGPESSGGAAETSLSSNTANAELGVQGTLLEMDVSKPTPVTVAMLIAMPRPPPPSASSAYHVPKTLNNMGQTQTGQGGEEEEVFFPHLELGVAEVVLLPLSESDHVDEERDGDMEEGEKERI